jgi:ABC-type Zn uptake system ZnuABC Zn-binding protein ZnuA
MVAPPMPSRRAALLLLAALLVAALHGFTASFAAPPPAGGPIRIVASIFPLGDVARQVGGEAVHVEVLLPPGVTPHGFEPKPPQAEMLSRADLLLRIGLGADPWARLSAEASGNERLRTLLFSETVGIDTLHVKDPHLWLDPVLMGHFVAVLSESLCAIRPAAAPGIRARAELFQHELTGLDREYGERLRSAKTRAFVSFHSAFTYIAERYDLDQAAVFEAHMEEPGPHVLEHVVTFIRDHGIHVLLAQPQIPLASAQWLREQTGVSIEVLDPLGSPQQEGYTGYLEMMRSNLETLTRALNR